LTPQQLDQLATQFETEEGAPLAVPYGEHLIAGNLIAHKYIPGTPQQNYVIALGEGWGGLGAHGEWEGPVTVWHAGAALSPRFTYAIWFDDTTPQGASLQVGNDGWNWVATNPTPYSGKYAHQSPNQGGTHQHYFQFATQNFPLVSGDKIYCFVYLDPTNPPTEIMLQFAIGGDFEHRAYWGANSIAFGTDGTDSRRFIAALPATGQWVRLDVDVSVVGLVGATIDGMAFTCFSGLATWDQVGKWNAPAANGYLFRPGIVPTDVQDIPHAGAQTTPSGAAYSGTANIFVSLDTGPSAEDRPDKFRGRFKTRRTYDYSVTGEQIGFSNTYSTNPARAAADRVLAYFQRIYRDNLALAQQKFRARIDWPSWKDWAIYNDQLIPWNKDGSGNIFIPRFEAHIAFTQDLILADALDQICGLAGAFWQDEGEQLIFLSPADRAPIHHFDESNIIAPPTITPVDLREKPNFFIADYREIDDQYLGQVTTDVKRQNSINQVGENKSRRTFANMHQSQAQRLLERQARIEHDNPIFCTLTGNAASIHVLPGDFVTVSHPVPNWNRQLCLVIDITVRSGEDSADEVEFTLQKIDGSLYSDDAHTPIQPTLTVP
jgi:hypothetical protein